MRRRISRAQQTKNWCVGFSLPPPAYAGIHPTLYLFGFRADALNSHSPPYLPGFDPRSCLERFDTLSGSSGKVVGSSEFWGASETCGGLPRASGEPPGACGVPPGASGGPRGDFGGLEPFFWVWTLGLVVGFAFQATSWRRLASGPPERRPENPRGQGCWV